MHQGKLARVFFPWLHRQSAQNWEYSDTLTCECRLASFSFLLSAPDWQGWGILVGQWLGLLGCRTKFVAPRRPRSALAVTNSCGWKQIVNLHFEAKGVRITTGTIVDATLIMPLPRLRTATRAATRRCTKPGKASNGTSQ